MAIPDFQSIMLPLLNFSADGEEHTMQEAYKSLADTFSLTNEDIQEMLPSGQQTRWKNRVAWSKAYFTKMGILDATKRGAFKITERGKKVLEDNPKRIDLKYLKKHFPKEFNAFHKSNNNKPSQLSDNEKASNRAAMTPEEMMELAYNDMRKALIGDLLEKLKQNSPAFFERTVVRLLVAMGYGGAFADAASVVGQSHDGGIDGIIKEDRLGLDKIYIQAKRYDGQTIGSAKIREFIGALHSNRASKGVFITTSCFSPDAEKVAAESHVVLIDGETLAGYMVDFNVGVSVEITYDQKKIDEDFFEE